jgi:hypothetical protein
MSLTNGRLPPGAAMLTLELLERATTALVRVPGASQKTGQEVYVKIRAIRKADYAAMIPPAPPGSEAWPEDREARDRLWREWLEGLPEDQRQARTLAAAEVTYKVIAAGLVEPRMTADDARALGDDADEIAVAILRLSGLLPPETPTEAAAAESSGA